MTFSVSMSFGSLFNCLILVVILFTNLGIFFFFVFLVLDLDFIQLYIAELFKIIVLYE